MRELIGLIDVDGHNFPNLALMKLSAYHKFQGDTVEWYDPNRSCYDTVYMSKVFSDEYSPDIPEPANARTVIKGGTGYAITLVDGKEVYDKALDPDLPNEVEHIYPDYSLYPEYTGYGLPLKKQTCYGFLTRGCPRGCGFCHVAPKEGKCTKKVADLSEFWRGQGKIILSDPNIMACPDWRDLFDQLIKSGAKIEFNQGLDARLLTPEKAEMLAQMKLKQPHFAMDNMKDVESVKRGIKLYVDACKRIRGKWDWRNAKVFCLVNFDTTFAEDMRRIKAIQECDCYPYVMVYNKPSAPPILRRLQRWTNSTALYARYDDFYEYQRDNYKAVIYPEKEEEMSNELTNLFIFDCEVFSDDNIWVFKNAETNDYTVIHNDNEALMAFMENQPWLVGYNNKNYDQYILKACLMDMTPPEVKQINDAIIEGGLPGWQIPQIANCGIYFDQFDLMDDTQKGTGLKDIEGHLGMDIQETTVPFNIDRPLTEKELEEVIYYCKHDVDATHILLKLREVYVANKLKLGQKKGIPAAKALYMTNAKLTAAYLDAQPKPHEDEREYVFPDNILWEYIPDEVKAFFDKIHDKSISDEKLWEQSITIMVGECETKLAFGGIHGSINNYTEEGDL